MATTDFKTIDEYIASFPEEVQVILQKIRKTIQDAIPEATEKISYQMPAFRLNGMLIWYAAWKNHIGIYPKTKEIEETFQKELAGYELSKGTIKFPLNKPIPYNLITEIAKFRVEENLKKLKKK